MTRIARAVARFKENPQLHLDHRLAHKACASAGYDWRERVLGPVVTLRLMIVQVLGGDVSCRALGRLSGMTFSVTAYCKTRARLPVDVLVGDRPRMRVLLVRASGAAITGRNARGLPGHPRLIVDFTPGRKGRKQLPKTRRRGAPPSRQLKGLGHDDQLVRHTRPSWQPDWMTAEHYAPLPGHSPSASCATPSPDAGSARVRSCS